MQGTRTRCCETQREILATYGSNIPPLVWCNANAVSLAERDEAAAAAARLDGGSAPFLFGRVIEMLT